LSCDVVLGTSDVIISKEEASPSSVQSVLEFCQQCFGSSEGIGGADFDFDSCDYSSAEANEITFNNVEPNECCLYAARATYPLYPDCEQTEVVECCSGGNSWIEAEVQLFGVTLDEYRADAGIEDALIESIVETSNVDPSMVHIISVERVDSVDVDGRRSLFQTGDTVKVTFVLFLQDPEQQDVAVADSIVEGWDFTILGEYITENVNPNADVREVNVVEIVVPTTIPTASPTKVPTMISTKAPTSNLNTLQPTFSPTFSGDDGIISGEADEATSGSFLQTDSFPILMATVILVVCIGVYNLRRERLKRMRKINADRNSKRLGSLRSSKKEAGGYHAIDTHPSAEGETRTDSPQDSPEHMLLPGVDTPKGDGDFIGSEQQSSDFRAEEPPPVIETGVRVDTEDPGFLQGDGKAGVKEQKDLVQEGDLVHDDDRAGVNTDTGPLQDNDKAQIKEHADVENGKRVILPHMDVPREQLAPTVEAGREEPENKEGIKEPENKEGINYCEAIFENEEGIDAAEKKKRKKKKKKKQRDGETLAEGEGDDIPPEKKKKRKKEKKSKKIKPEGQDTHNSENMGSSGVEGGPQMDVRDERDLYGSSSVAADGFSRTGPETLEKNKGKELESLSVDRNPFDPMTPEGKKKKKKKKKDPLSTERTPKNEHKKKKRKKKSASTVPTMDSEGGGDHQPPPGGQQQPPTGSSSETRTE